MTVIMDPGGNVSHVGHLGGVLVGWLYLRERWHPGSVVTVSRSSSIAGAASECASVCAPSGMTTSRRGAAATTTGRCTEAMSNPTPSPDFVISQTLEEQIARAAELIERARSVVALTGAGLSVESGIPPFRGPGGLWTKYGEPAARRLPALPARSQAGLAGSLSPREPWAQALAETLGSAKPSAGHRALAELEAIGRCDGRHHPEHRRPPTARPAPAP